MSIRTVQLPTEVGESWTDLGWPSKSPADDLDYEIDAARWLADAGKTLVSAEATWSPGLIVTGPTLVDGTIICLRISGGTPGTTATVRVMLRLSSDEDLEVVVSLPIRSAAPDGLVGGSGSNGPTHTADGPETIDTTTITADAA